jgi:mycofactocin radical SAM maturase
MNIQMLSAPHTVMWEVTYACNLRCIYCYSEAGPQSSYELTTKEGLDLIDQLSKAKVFMLSFGGGEPFIRKDFLDILQYACTRNIGTIISTNGSLIGDNIARLLQKCEVKTIQVSLDASSHCLNDKVRGRGTFDKAVNAIRLLRKRNLNVIISTVINRMNFSDLLNLCRLASKYGVKAVRLLRLIPMGRGKHSFLHLNKGQYIELVNLINTIESRTNVKLLLGCSFSFLNPYRNLAITCPAGLFSCGISPEGYVIPCSLFSDRNTPCELECDNIRNDRFISIWKKSKVLNVLRNLKLPKRCIQCSKAQVCNGGCRAASYGYTGRLDSPDPECLYGDFEKLT